MQLKVISNAPIFLSHNFHFVRRCLCWKSVYNLLVWICSLNEKMGRAWILFRQGSIGEIQTATELSDFHPFFPNILHFSTEEFYSVKCVQKGAFSGQTYFSPSPSQNWDKNKLLYPSVGVLFCTREMEKLCFQKGIFLLCWFCCVANMNPEQCLLSCQICEKSLCGRTASICANS